MDPVRYTLAAYHATAAELERPVDFKCEVVRSGDAGINTEVEYFSWYELNDMRTMLYFTW